MGRKTPANVAACVGLTLTLFYRDSVLLSKALLVDSNDQLPSCVLWLCLLRRGRALRSDPGPRTRGWLRKNRRSRPSSVGLCAGCRGFRVFTSILMVRLRRGRPLDPRLRRRRAFFARHPYCFCFFHCGSPELLT